MLKNLGKVPNKAFVLITGDNGVGKSILALQLASELNKKTLIVSTQEDEEEIKRRVETFNFNLKEYKVEFISNEIYEGLDSTDLFTIDFEGLLSLVLENYEVIVLDSIDFLEFMFEDFNLFRKALIVLKNIARKQNKILIAVSSVYSDPEKESFEQFLSDIVIEMYYKDSERYLFIKKNRFSKHDNKERRFKIEDKKGIVIL